MPQNYTIDDSQWSTSSLLLSEGWNMLRIDGSNEYINSDQVNEMIPILDQFWNKSISWTESAGGWMELAFVGTDIWSYGINGPYHGTIEFSLDNQLLGTWSQNQEDYDYHHLIFELHDLEDREHTLKMVNVAGGDEKRRMSFDYAIIQSDRYFENSQTVPESSSTPTIPESTNVESITQESATVDSATIESTTIESLTNTIALAAQITSSPTSTIITPEQNSTSVPLIDSNLMDDNTTSITTNQTQIPPQLAAAAAAAASSSALAALLPTQYSLTQLASLKEVYKFTWNPAAYFVVIFSSVVVVVFILFMIHISLKSWIKKNRGFSEFENGYNPTQRNSKAQEPPSAVNGMRIGSPMNAKKNGEVDF